MRYFKVTLLCGFLASLIVAGLYELHLFWKPDFTLWNLLGRNTLLPTEARSPVQYAVFIILAFGLAWTTVDISRFSLKSIVALGALLEVLAASAVLGLFQIFFSPFPGALAIVLSFIFGMIYSRSDAGKRKRIARLMFGNRLSRASFYRLVNSNTPLSFEGEKCEVSVLICEAVNREDLAESLSGEDYTAMTNLFLRTTTEFLVDKGAYLDECDGEMVRVVYGAPMPDAAHALTACKAALELKLALEKMNADCFTRWQQKCEISISVNSGEVVAAAYGSQRLGAFTVSGEPVEFAKKLSEANAVYKSKIAIGERTLMLTADEIEVRPVEMVNYRDTPLRDEVYELLSLRGEMTDVGRSRRDEFWKGVVLSREERWEDALTHLRSSLAKTENDGAHDKQNEDAKRHEHDELAEFYIQRVEAARNGTHSAEWERARF